MMYTNEEIKKFADAFAEKLLTEPVAEKYSFLKEIFIIEETLIKSAKEEGESGVLMRYLELDEIYQRRIASWHGFRNREELIPYYMQKIVTPQKKNNVIKFSDYRKNNP